MGLCGRHAASGPAGRGREPTQASARRAGRYGPSVREVVPGFVALAGLVAAPVLLCGWLYARYRLGGLITALIVVCALLVPLTRWARAASRRHGGIWSEDELLALQDEQLYAAVRTVVRRDGWRIRNVPCGDRPRLVGRHPDTRIRIEVGFRLPGEGAQDLDVCSPGDPHPLPRDTGDGQGDGVVRLLVSRGEYSPGDLRRARGSRETYLIGRQQLTTWAAGLPLNELLDLPRSRGTEGNDPGGEPT